MENYERYHSLVKATNDTVWDWDLRTDEVSWNEGIQNVFGHRVAGLVSSQTWHFENIHPEDRKRVVENIYAGITHGTEQWNEEYRYRCEDGIYKFVFDRGFILQDENKNAYRMIGVMMDITDRKKKQQEIVRNQIERQKLVTAITIQTQEKERKEIGLELHDNINQILATAKLYVKVALKEEEIEKELLYKSYDCITRAIKEIRFISKSLILGSLKDIRLAEGLQEIVENLNVSNTLSVTLSIHGVDIEKIPVDKKLAIYRIAQEQANNILKHARASVASIDITSIDNRIWMVIRDNGVGVDAAQHNKGIGLHNIASRVEMLKGDLEVNTATGQGYTLKIGLPIE